MELLIVGTGYVGLVTGACFAEVGHHVTCLDIDHEKITKLKQGMIPIYEPGLEALVKKHTLSGHLRFKTDYAEALTSAHLCFIAVPTPSLACGSCDMTFVEQAARQIGSHMTGDLILVNKSTVSVGAAKKIKAIVAEELKKRNVSHFFDVVSNPEFLKEGSAVFDCLHPDRIVIGANCAASANFLKAVYEPFGLSPEQIFVMDSASAEMTKYAANAMLATRISFMNEIASICKKVGADVNEVRKGIGSDPRIGSHFLNPGIGYGGSCFPKDVRALISMAQQLGVESTLLEAADAVNEKQKKWLAQQIAQYFSLRGGLKGKTVAIWGLSFKPNTDDMREAPSLTIIEGLLQQGANLRVFDPIAMPNAKKQLGERQGIFWCENEMEAASGADAIALLTEWNQFRLVNLKEIAKRMQGWALFDGRNQYRATDAHSDGFDYIPIGAPDQIKLS